MLPYQAMAMDYAVASPFQRQSPGAAAAAAAVGAAAALNMNPAFTHSCILELRKEKSRDAARSRRGKENFEFYELAKMLPLPAAITSQLDKASIIRLTISYLKLRDFSGHGDPPWNRDGPPPNKSLKGGPVRPRSSAGIAMEMFEQHQGTHILQSLDGFAFALAADGRFLYISETVSIYLGLSQVEMTGSSMFDYVHQQDHSELAEQLGLGLAQGQGLASPGSAASDEGAAAAASGTNNPDVATMMTLSSNASYKGLERAFCVRMKSTLTKRGCHFKSSGYRVVLVLCRLRPQYTFSHARKAAPPLLGMVAIAMALPPPSVHEIRLESDMFVTRINFDFRIAHCEPRVSDLLDYSADELTGRNLYGLCHGEDANKLRKAHMDLINKGQVMTQYYRLMNKNGGYTWLQTCATVVCNSKNADEQNIICVNYIISGREFENLIMDCCQLEEGGAHVKREEAAAGGNDPENGSPDADRGGRSSGGPAPPPAAGERRSPGLEEGGAAEAPGAGAGERQAAGAGAAGGHGGRARAPPPPLAHAHTHAHAHAHAHTPPAHAHLAAQPQQATAAMDAAQLGGGLAGALKKQLDGAAKEGGERRGHKRKPASTLHDEDSSCCSSEDEDDDDEAATARGGGGGGGGGATPRAGRPALSPASSCHSAAAAAAAAVAAAAQGPPKPDDDPPGGASVKDLEHAMSKHLPSAALAGAPKGASPPLQPHQPTDFSADALLKQQQQRSTIQWIGAHHHHHLNSLNHAQQLAAAAAAQHSAAAPLPASALLRQLYANRESVIRANVHAAAAAARGGGGGGAAGGGGNFYAGDVGQVGPLPTPPGSDGSSAYGDQFVLAAHKPGGVNGADAFGSLVSSYSSPGGYAVDYHSAMTPPSSVSPRDKHTQQLHSGSAAAAAAAAAGFDSPYSDMLRHQYLGGGGGAAGGGGGAGAGGGGAAEAPAQPLPLKPQVYSAVHHSALDAAAAYAASTSLDQSQFYHHSVAGGGGAGFHLYHPTANKGVSAAASVYPDALKNSSNWYSTAS